MSELENKIQGYDDFACLKPATCEQIREAESVLGLTFAEDYKDYLKTFGAATFDSRELTGICSSERLNVVSVTLHQREKNPYIPANCYVIEELNVDGVVAWQDETGSVYLASYDKKIKKVSNCLLDYFAH